MQLFPWGEHSEAIMPFQNEAKGVGTIAQKMKAANEAWQPQMLVYRPALQGNRRPLINPRAMPLAWGQTFASKCCAISRLRKRITQSRVWHATSGFRECAAQSQRNIFITVAYVLVRTCLYTRALSEIHEVILDNPEYYWVYLQIKHASRHVLIDLYHGSYS